VSLTTPVGARRSRAVRPGSGRTRLVLVVVAFAVLLAVLAYGVYGLVSGGRQTYAGANPATWLPEQQLRHPVDKTIVGTYRDPAITVAGGDVRVQTPTFSALAVVTGPLVPGEGYNYQPQYVVGTWTVHLWDVKGFIPLSTADFDSIDHLGTEFHLQVPQGTTMPKAVRTGGQVTFQLRTVVPIGEDVVRWAPNGNDIVAKWDNQVEND
jgi:hypothetical protein